MSLEIGQVIDEQDRIRRLMGEGGLEAVYDGDQARIPAFRSLTLREGFLSRTADEPFHEM